MSEETPFLTNAKGIPISEGDVLCMAIQKRLIPGKSFQDFCTRIKEDPQFAKSAMAARSALAKETESSTGLPTFLPASSVGEDTIYGHVVYSKAGLLTEGELTRHTSKTAKELGLQVFSSEWQSPTNKVNFYIISLLGLPPDLLASIRKVKLFHQTSIRSEKNWLTPQLQLTKNQAKDISDHLHTKYSDPKLGKRPGGIVNQTTYFRVSPDLG